MNINEANIPDTIDAAVHAWFEYMTSNQHIDALTHIIKITTSDQRILKEIITKYPPMISIISDPPEYIKRGLSANDMIYVNNLTKKEILALLSESPWLVTQFSGKNLEILKNEILNVEFVLELVKTPGESDVNIEDIRKSFKDEPWYLEFNRLYLLGCM